MFEPCLNHHSFPFCNNLVLGLPFGCVQNISPRFSSTVIVLLNSHTIIKKCKKPYSFHWIGWLKTLWISLHGTYSCYSFNGPSYCPHIAPMRSAHKAWEDLNTLELILRKGLKKLPKLILSLRWSYGIKHPLLAIHPIQVYSLQALPSKFYFGSCRWIFMCSVPLPPFPQPLLKPPWPLKQIIWN